MLRISWSGRLQAPLLPSVRTLFTSKILYPHPPWWCLRPILVRFSINDPLDPNFTASFYYDDYLVTGLTAGQTVTVRLRSTSFDTYLAVINDADGSIVLDNDNDDGTDSEISFCGFARW